MEEFKVSQVETLGFQSLDDMAEAQATFDKICSEYKSVMKKRFTYKIEPDYEKLELNITLNFIQEDDYTERNTQLN